MTRVSNLQDAQAAASRAGVLANNNALGPAIIELAAAVALIALHMEKEIKDEESRKLRGVE